MSVLNKIFHRPIHASSAEQAIDGMPNSARRVDTAVRDVDDLLDGLRDGDPHRRRDAAAELGDAGDARALEPLIAAMHDDAPFVGKAAAQALGRLGDRRALAPLLEAVRQSENRSLQIGATVGLGALGDHSVVDVLRSIAEDRTIVAALQANEALYKLGERPPRPCHPEHLAGSARGAALERKADYRRAAVAWWTHTDRSEAVCDDCNTIIARGEGFLRPGYLACEDCTDLIVSGFYDT